MTESNIEPTLDAKPTVKQRILRQVRNLALGYAMVVVMLAFFQRKLIYVPSRAAELPASMVNPFGDGPQEVVDLTTTTSDGIELHGWHYRSGALDTHDITDGRLVVLFFHGNGGHRLHRASDCELLKHLDADTVIFDYRGYGDNAGKPTEEGLTLDAKAAWKFVTSELGVDPSRVIVFGESLGGGVAVRLTSELCQQGTTPAGLVLRSTFSSLTDAASFHYPWLPVRTILADRYPSVTRIADVNCPILAIHGDDDTIVPFGLGETLFASAPAESSNGIAKRFETIHGAGHNDVLALASGQVQKAIGEFFAAIRSLR